MKYFKFKKSTGLVDSVIQTSSLDLEFQNQDVEFGYIEVSENTDPESYTIINNSLNYIGPRPSFDHEIKNHQWVLNVQKQYERLSSNIRKERDELLAKSDYTDLVSFRVRMGNDVYNLWQTYRQALRDITSQVGFPTNVTFPAKPS